MTAPRHRLPRRTRPARGWPFVAQVHRSRADAWPLALVGVALTLTVLLADAAPRVMTRVADQTVREAVAGRPTAALTVSAPIAEGYAVLSRDPGTADRVAAVGEEITAALPPVLASVLGPPVGTVRTAELDVVVPGGEAPAAMRMAYVWRDGASGVEWIDGAAPGPSPGGDLSGEAAWTWPVEVGLSAPVAEALGARVGERLTVAGPDRSPLDVTVSGVFRALDEDDPVWAGVPGMLQPVVRGTGAGLTTTVAAYLSATSLPDARLALGLDPAGVTRSFVFAPKAAELGLENHAAVAQVVSGLEAAPQTLEIIGPRPAVSTELDSVLRAAGARVRAAGAQASVLLVGVLAACAAVLGLGAWLLVRRRAAVLGGARARGATLPALALGPLAEHLALAVVAATIGLTVSRILVPGPPSWAWVAPVLAVAVLPAPALSLAAAGLADVRRTVVDRHHRRRALRVRQVRRAAAEGALVLTAAAAVLTLRSRGLPADPGSADLLLVAAPTLAAAAVGVVGARATRALERAVRPAASRLRSLTPVLAAARGAAAAGATVPFVALTVCVGLAGFAAVVAGTLQGGQLAGSWDTVGADVVVRTSGDAPLDQVAETVAGSPGVESVAVGRLERTVQVFGVPTTGRVDVLAVDAEELARLWRASARPGPAALSALTEAPVSGGALPALVSRSLADDLTAGDAIAWGDVRIEITSVGVAPALPTALVAENRTEDDLVVVDRAALAAVSGADVAADVLWAVGPLAERVVAGEPGLADAEVTGREAWLAERRGEPLTAGLLLLLRVAWPVLIGLAAVVVVLAAAATAPGRSRTLAVLRVLGLGPRGIARITLGELLPWVLLATACGVVVGGALAAVLLGPLELRLVTGQAADPAPAGFWWAAAALPLMGLVVAGLVAVEQSVRRQEKLGRVMRVGG